MWNKEEIEFFSIDHFRLFDKALINISSLRRILNAFSLFFEESLSYSFIHYNKCDMGWSNHSRFGIIFFCYYFLQLFEFILDYLFSHWVSNSISIYKNMIRHLSLIKVSIGLKWILEIFLKYGRRYYLLTFLCLGTGLRIILTEVLVIGCYKSNYALSSFMTNINSNKHSFLWNFFSIVHSP